MASSYCSVCSGAKRSRAITRAKVVSAAGGALGVLVSTEAMENELWAVDLDIIRALICALRRLRAANCERPRADEATQFGFSSRRNLVKRTG